MVPAFGMAFYLGISVLGMGTLQAGVAFSRPGVHYGLEAIVSLFLTFEVFF